MHLEDDASDSGHFQCSLQLGWFISFAILSKDAKELWFKILNTASKDDMITIVDWLVERWHFELPEHREQHLLYRLTGTHSLSINLLTALHLVRLDAQRQDPIHFEQSAELQLSLAYLNYFVHKPWAAAVPMSAITLLSEKDITGNVAQFCCEVMDSLYRRNPSCISLSVVHGFAVSTVVLQTGLWAVRKRTDVSATTVTKLMAVYERALENMKITSRRFVWPHEGYNAYFTQISS